MRISQKRTFVTLIATAAAVAAVAAGGGQAQAASPVKTDKPEGSHAQADPAFPVKESAASKGVVSSAASRSALATVQARIANYVAKNGTKYSFGTYADPPPGTSSSTPTLRPALSPR